MKLFIRLKTNSSSDSSSKSLTFGEFVLKLDFCQKFKLKKVQFLTCNFTFAFAFTFIFINHILKKNFRLVFIHFAVPDRVLYGPGRVLSQSNLTNILIFIRYIVYFKMNLVNCLIVSILVIKFSLYSTVEYNNERNNFKIQNFETFQNINASEIYFNASMIYFIPNNIINLDKKFQLNSNNYYSVQMLFYYFLNGIDILNSNLLLNGINQDVRMVYVLKSDFNIFFNKTWIKKKFNCENISSISFDPLSISASIELSLEDNLYSTKTCPIIFKNSILNSISFNSMKDSIIKKNFIQFFYFENLDLNCKIVNVQFTNVYRLKLSNYILDKNVFKLTNSIRIDGLLNQFRNNDIFLHLNNLNFISFSLNNLGEFFGYGLSWIRWINYNQNNTTIIKFEKILNDIYDFPEEDFCLIKDLIENKKIYLQSDYLEYLESFENISCTLLVLVNKMNIVYLNSIYAFDTCCQKNFTIFKNKYLTKCNAEYRLTKCMNTNLCHDTMNLKDYYEIIQYFTIILEIIIQPVICFIGIQMNFLIIYLFKSSKTKKEFDKEIFNFLYLNSVFNLIILSIDFLKIINYCTQFNLNICFSIKFTYFAQYLFILFNFLESVLNFCSNFTMLIFTIKRLLFFSINPSSLSRKFSRIKDKNIILTILIIGIVFNMAKLIEYEINTDKTQNDFPIKVINKSYQSRDNLNIFILIFYFILSLDFLFTFLFYVANLLIDIKLFYCIKKFLQPKTIFNIVNYFTNNVQQYEKKKTTTFRMILFYGIFNFMIRTPEFVLSSVIFIHYLNEKRIFFGNDQFRNNNDLIFGENTITDKLLQLFMVINKLNYLSNFFILYFFNKIFRTNVSKTCLRLKKKMILFYHYLFSKRIYRKRSILNVVFVSFTSSH